MEHTSMPRSCGLTLRTLRIRKKLNNKALVRHLLPHSKRFRGEDYFSDDTIFKAEHSQQTLYWLLDAYAKWSGYPVGVIYLFARVSSELRDGDIAAAEAIASSLRTFAALIDADAKRLIALQPILAARPDGQLDGIAYDTVRGYQKLLPRDHHENEGRAEGQEIKYTASQQIVDDARQVRILLELLSKVPPPFGDERVASTPGGR